LYKSLSWKTATDIAHIQLSYATKSSQSTYQILCFSSFALKPRNCTSPLNPLPPPLPSPPFDSRSSLSSFNPVSYIFSRSDERHLNNTSIRDIQSFATCKCQSRAELFEPRRGLRLVEDIPLRRPLTITLLSVLVSADIDDTARPSFFTLLLLGPAILERYILLLRHDVDGGLVTSRQAI
jgi:hypothetical protein